MHLYSDSQSLFCSEMFITWLAFWLTSIWRGSLTSQELIKNQHFRSLVMCSVVYRDGWENVYALWTVLLLIHQTLNTFDPINYPCRKGIGVLPWFFCGMPHTCSFPTVLDPVIPTLILCLLSQLSMSYTKPSRLLSACCLEGHRTPRAKNTTH